VPGGGGHEREQEGEEAVQAGEDGRLETGGLGGILGEGGTDLTQYGREVAGGGMRGGRGAVGGVVHIC
jgi:hypothetical protein